MRQDWPNHFFLTNLYMLTIQLQTYQRLKVLNGTISISSMKWNSVDNFHQAESPSNRVVLWGKNMIPWINRKKFEDFYPMEEIPQVCIFADASSCETNYEADTHQKVHIFIHIQTCIFINICINMSPHNTVHPFHTSHILA